MHKKLFVILVLSALILNILSQKLLNINDLVINSFSETFTQEQVEQMLELKNGWQWIQYFLIPLLLFFKVLIISAILDVGCFFFSKEIKYKKLFNMVIKAEFVFLLVLFCKTSWFYFFQTGYTLEDLQYFYPLSALNIIGYKGLQPWFIYPFQVLNLFELAYWFILAYLLGKEIKETTEKGFVIISSSYGVGLLIWIVGVMFLTLNMS